MVENTWVCFFLRVTTCTDCTVQVYIYIYIYRVSYCCRLLSQQKAQFYKLITITCYIPLPVYTTLYLVTKPTLIIGKYTLVMMVIWWNLQVYYIFYYYLWTLDLGLTRYCLIQVFPFNSHFIKKGHFHRLFSMSSVRNRYLHKSTETAA